jgi:hypothetical protein
LQTWLTQSCLIQTPDLSCLLLVDNSTLELLHNLSYLSSIYPIVQSIYPDVTSLFISSTSFQEFIKTGKIEVYSVEVNNNDHKQVPIFGAFE